MLTNKNKIINDPVNGFIYIKDEIIFDLIEHSYFQRLRRISQTGFTYYVYPGAMHTRFHHSLGALHLMQTALHLLREKKVEISEEEERAALIAILLHDLGHTPFSHALESLLIDNINHEDISLLLMNSLNEEFNGALSLAIDIFLNRYPRNFFHQLISGEIDVDRLDYLRRDSFYTGVVEGNINSERIITMLNVFDNELVIDSKGIYSIENYITSRMFMYWQVYFHKTSFAVEVYLKEAIYRAKELIQQGVNVPATDCLHYFLSHNKFENFNSKDIEPFIFIDDSDIITALKWWINHPDKILSSLSRSVMKRQLPNSFIRFYPFSENAIDSIRKETEKLLKIENAKYFVHQNELEVLPYNPKKGIRLLQKHSKVVNLENADNNIIINSLSTKIKRYHICFPRELTNYAKDLNL